MNTVQNNNRLPLMAMDFNGLYIENKIDSYKTFKVIGRETTSNELVFETVEEGTLTTNVQLPPRELEITYILKRKNSKQLQNDFKRLRNFLTSDEQVPIRFNDDPETFYFGRLSTMEQPPDDSNTVVGTFIIHCDSPYKFGDLITTNGQVAIDTFYKTYPERITLEVPTTRNNIEIKNGTERITATGTFNAGSKVVVGFKKEEVTMTVNGVEATYMLDLQSDLENFELRQGQTVTSPHGDITLEMRERWL